MIEEYNRLYKSGEYVFMYMASVVPIYTTESTVDWLSSLTSREKIMYAPLLPNMMLQYKHLDKSKKIFISNSKRLNINSVGVYSSRWNDMERMEVEYYDQVCLLLIRIFYIPKKEFLKLILSDSLTHQLLEDSKKSFESSKYLVYDSLSDNLKEILDSITL